MSLTRRIQKLASFSEDSRRYKVASFSWKDQHIRRSRVCVFYCLMLPAAVLNFSILLTAYLLVLTPVQWLSGFTPSFIKDRGAGAVGGGTYSYKYSPRKGRFRRFAPWQLFVPAVAGSLMATSHYRLVAVSILLALLFVVVWVGMATLSNHAIRHNWSGRWHQYRIAKHNRWLAGWRNFKDAACPLIHVEDKEPVSTT